MNKQIHIFVSGEVQGVSFRYYTKEMADKFNLVGEVSNLTDGRVEIIAQGVESDLNKLLEWTHIGPSSAHVERVDYQFELINQVYTNFEIS